MKCKKCGKKLRRNEKFCLSCGYYNDENEDSTNFFTPNDASLDDDGDDDVEIVEEDSFDDVESNFQEIQKEVNYNNKRVEKIQKKFIGDSEKEIDYYGEDEDFIESYIGEDYKIIKKMPFNIYAFLLNWLYFLYRKLYITGIIGLIITLIIIAFIEEYLLIYLMIIMVILGFAFNKYYIFICKRRIEKIKVEYDGSDRFNLNNICKEKGGVNTLFALIIYFVFLVLVVIIVAPFSFYVNKQNTKYWKVNSENQATCNSLAKIAYNEVNQKNTKYDISEGVCKKLKTSENYEIYLKATDKENNSIVYFFYKTENEYLVFKLDTKDRTKLVLKKANNTITNKEKEKLTEMTQVEQAYTEITNNSKREDELIVKKEDKEQKTNYIFNRNELLR